MIDVKAVREANKLRIYAKIPGGGSAQARQYTKDVVGKVKKGYDTAFADYRDFYAAHRGPGDPSFTTVPANGFEKVFEAYTVMGGAFKFTTEEVVNTKELINFDKGSFAMGAINVLSTITNMMPLLDAPLMSTYKGMSPIDFTIDCYLNLEDWRELHTDYIIKNNPSAADIVDFCYNYPILRLLSLVLPFRLAKFGQGVDDFFKGRAEVQALLDASYDGNVFNPDKFRTNLDKMLKEDAAKDLKDRQFEGNTLLRDIANNEKNDKGESLYETESQIRKALANPVNYIDYKDGQVTMSTGFFYNLGMAVGEMTDTKHGSDDTLVKLAKYLGGGILDLAEMGKKAFDDYIGDMYYLRAPFPFVKIAESDQRGFTIFYGSKRFDEVFLTKVDFDIPNGYYEGGVPSQIDLKLKFQMRRRPTLDTFNNFLYHNDPMRESGKEFTQGYDNEMTDRERNARSLLKPALFNDKGDMLRLGDIDEVETAKNTDNPANA